MRLLARLPGNSASGLLYGWHVLLSLQGWVVCGMEQGRASGSIRWVYERNRGFPMLLFQPHLTPSFFLENRLYWSKNEQVAQNGTF
jgi:hypothetical protein